MKVQRDRSQWTRREKWDRIRRYYYHRIFPRKRTAYEVGMSVFLGVFIGILPTIGIAIPLTVLACHFVKVPKIPGVVSSFIAVPFTLFPFFYPLGLTVGIWILNPPPSPINFLKEFAKLRLNNISEVMGPILAESSHYFWAFLSGISIVALAFAVGLGILAFYVMKFRKTRQQSRT